MNPDEMERHLMNGSRAAYLKMQSLMERCPTGEASIADGHWIQHGSEPPERWNPVGPVKLQLTESESFLLTVPSNVGLHAVPAPYEVIEGAWLGVDGKIHVLLTKRLLFRGGIIGLARIGPCFTASGTATPSQPMKSSVCCEPQGLNVNRT